VMTLSQAVILFRYPKICSVNSYALFLCFISNLFSSVIDLSS
jgi:hypothetical protein